MRHQSADAHIDDLREEVASLKRQLADLQSRTCANCKWWECKPGQKRGTCIAVNWPPKGREGLAFIHKGTGPLETHETFSCNQWEPKEPSRLS